MKIMPQNFLGFWVIIAISIIAFVFYLAKDANKSLITITGQDNRFYVNFDLNAEDQKNLTKILGNLQIPQGVREDLSFELDSTSSASLVFLTPIEVKPTIGTEQVSFSGTLSHSPFIEKLSPKKIKVPEDYNLAIFAPYVLDFVTTRNLYPQGLVNWLKNNFNSTRGQYFIIFGKEAQFTIIQKDSEVDFSSLKSIELSDELEDAYKEEVRDDITFYLVNIEITEEKSGTVAFFRYEDWQVFASSREAAFKMAGSLKSKNSTDFPSFNFDSSSNFLLSLVNKEGLAIEESFINLISSSNSNFTNPNLPKILRGFETINFALKADKFSGLISLR